MSLEITKECFPPATDCFNCQRKRHEDILEKPHGSKQELKRCNRCHLLTYCDQDCQREHWQVVHKRHCGFLSGQKLAKNSYHIRDNCSFCAEARNSTVSEIKSIRSPKSTCYLERLSFIMKRLLGSDFNFHDEGKKCKCSLNNACELPFALGELSGKYVGNGLDEMLAHALKIVNAMRLKSGNTFGVVNQNETLDSLWDCLVRLRVTFWKLALTYGAPRFQDDSVLSKYISEPVEKLKNTYGANDPWWKALYFTVSLVVYMNDLLLSEYCDSNGLEDQKFSIFRKLLNYEHSQLRNQQFVTENNLWARFKLWPVQENGKLILLMPNGTHCQICQTQLTGQFSVIGNVATSKEICPPMMIPRIGGNGQLVISCSAAKKPKCREEMMMKDLIHSVGVDEDEWRKYVEEQKTFMVLSRFCDFCLKQNLSSHRCSECKAAQYCSVECQRQDLNFHKTVCSTWARDQFRKIGGKKLQKKKHKSQMDQLSENMDQILKEHYESNR